MRLIIVILACFSLSGCWFVFIPVDTIADALTDSHGNLCAPDTVKVGDTNRGPDGRMMRITKINGLSGRCGKLGTVRVEAYPVEVTQGPPADTSYAKNCTRQGPGWICDTQ